MVVPQPDAAPLPAQPADMPRGEAPAGVPNSGAKPYPVVADDGQVVGYLVQAEYMKRMQDELAALREQVTTLERRNRHLVADLTEVLKTYIPIPPTEDEMLAAVPNSDEIDKIIAYLESQQG